MKYKELHKNNTVRGNLIIKDKYGFDEDNKQKNKEDNYLELIWKRTLHKDAYQLHK